MFYTTDVKQLDLSVIKVFGFKNAKINVFEEKMVLNAVFIRLKCRWLQTGLDYLEKH